MAIQQLYRGNPSVKEYQLSQNFIGGLNTKEADDVVTDIEFRELLNADLGNQGIITNRKGFKDLIVFNEMLENLVDQKGDAATFPEGVLRLAKVVVDKKNIIQQLLKFDSLSAFRTFAESVDYEVIFMFLVNSSFFRLKISKPENQSVEKVEIQQQHTITTGSEAKVIREELDINNIYFGGGTSSLVLQLPVIPTGYELTSVILKTIEYQLLTSDPVEGLIDLNFPFITNSETENNHVVNYEKNLKNTNYSFIPVPDFENFNYDIKASFYTDGNINGAYVGSTTVPKNVSYNNSTLAFKLVIEYVFTEENTQINEVSLSEFNSKLSVNNIEFLDSLFVLPGNGELYEYEILEDKTKKVEPYKPTPFDVKYVGFNVFSESPLTFIDDQGISNKNIEGFFLTVDGNKPIQTIPGGLFQINVIHTGTSFSTSEVGIEFYVDFGSDKELQIFPTFQSAKDLGGLFVFEYNASNLSKHVTKEITIRLFELQKTVLATLKDKVLFADGQKIEDRFFSPIILDTLAGINEGLEFILWQNTSYQTVRIAPYSLIPQLTPRVESHENLASFPATGITSKIYYAEDTLKTYKYTTANGYEEILVAVLDRRVATDYFTEQNAAFVTLGKKTENIEFEPFVDFFAIEAFSNVLPTPVTKLQLQNFKMVQIDYRMVYYGDKVIWFSDLYQFNYIPNYNFISLPLGTTDQIQRIVFFRGAYIIFTKEEIYRMSGTFGTQNFKIDSVNKFVGCIAPNSVRNVGNELLFLSRDGLYKLKSSIFQDNLENVEKIDKVIVNDVKISEFADSLLYDEQYILYYNDEDREYDTLRMYYDIDLGRSRSPFVRDIFTVKPELLVREEGRIFAVSEGRWYIYGEGHTDFMPDGEEDASNYTYTCRIETPSLSLRYPTHEKKFKNIFIKALHGDKIVPLFVTIKVDNYDVLVPSELFAFVNQFGEVEYSVSADPNITLISSAFLGELELGLTPLGEITQQVHKLSFSGKGKNIKIIIEQKLDASFGIISMGYLFKLGKVKE